MVCKRNGYDIEADEIQMIKTISSRASLEAIEVSEPQIIKTTVNKLNFIKIFFNLFINIIECFIVL